MRSARYLCTYRNEPEDVAVRRAKVLHSGSSARPSSPKAGGVELLPLHTVVIFVLAQVGLQSSFKAEDRFLLLCKTILSTEGLAHTSTLPKQASTSKAERQSCRRLGAPRVMFISCLKGAYQIFMAGCFKKHSRNTTDYINFAQVGCSVRSPY
ncbi:hypothetical protein L7F22_020948 [Adiantum nelumboides]|nr:hypothetical protein [Adiantum nelumboides]